MRTELLAIVGLLCANQAIAQERLEVPVNSTIRIQLKQPVRTIVVPDEGILHVETIQGSDRMLRLSGQNRGTTTLSAQNEKGDVFYTAIVTVGPVARQVTIISVEKGGGNRARKGPPQSTLSLHDEYTYNCTENGCERVKESKRDKRLDRWSGVQPGEEQAPASPQTRQLPDEAD